LGVNTDFPLSVNEKFLANSIDGDTKKVTNKTIPTIDSSCFSSLEWNKISFLSEWILVFILSEFKFIF
jgi:hypothetical protein